jgi:hypothetical protein
MVRTLTPLSKLSAYEFRHPGHARLGSYQRSEGTRDSGRFGEIADAAADPVTASDLYLPGGGAEIAGAEVSTAITLSRDVVRPPAPHNGDVVA